MELRFGLGFGVRVGVKGLVAFVRGVDVRGADMSGGQMSGIRAVARARAIFAYFRALFSPTFFSGRFMQLIVCVSVCLCV